MAGADFPKTDRGWQAYLANVRAPEERLQVLLGAGLWLVLEPSGVKTFYSRVRRIGDKNPKWIRLGTFPELSVADARRELDKARSAAREGRDPALETRRAKAGLVTVRTLTDLIAEYLARREQGEGRGKKKLAPKTIKLERDLLEGVLLPALGDRLPADLEPQDFGRAVSKYAARLRKEGRSDGTNANKLLAACRRMFKTARGWGLYTSPDPTAGLARPAQEAPSDRILFDGKILVAPDPKLNELGALVAALQADPCEIPVSRPTRIALLLTVHLGFRALEVSSLEWSSVRLDGDAPSLTVTTSKTKAGLRALPLPSSAVALISELKKNASKRARYVFPAGDGAKRAGHMHPESMSRAFARASARLGIAGASVHDLRRTCLSGLIELGHEAVAGRIAGHAARDVMGRHYDRSARLEPMRAALVEWASAVDRASARHNEESAR